jgi:hypothetical protein
MRTVLIGVEGVALIDDTTSFKAVIGRFQCGVVLELMFSQR